MAEVRRGGAGGNRAQGEEQTGPQKIKIMTFIDDHGQTIFAEPKI